MSNPKVYIASPFFPQKRISEEVGGTGRPFNTRWPFDPNSGIEFDESLEGHEIVNPNMDTVKGLETAVEDCGYEALSPRRDGTMIDSDSSLEEWREAFQWNVDSIEDSDVLIANIDDVDQGTSFEHGLAYEMDCHIITFTTRDYTLNLMLAQSVLAHATAFYELKDILYRLKGIITEGSVDQNTKKTLASIQADYMYTGSIE